MITSEDQRGNMRKLPEHSRVRRKLFADDIQDQASIDNFTNILQEITKRDTEIMSKKWNFDFVKEVPLDGNYEWEKKDGDIWIGIKPEAENTENNIPDSEISETDDTEDEFIPIILNETTPNINTNDSLPLVRKRRRETSLTDKGARRKISFD